YKNDIHTIIKRISNVIRKYQVTTLVTILVTQRPGLEVTSLNLSAIFQNIILLRFIEVNGYMKRILTLLKITSTQQDQSILEFKITTKKGMEIIGPVNDYYEGIFTNVFRIKDRIREE
ncbi:MAG TPA: hypothetical protein VN704_10585, partial [Verrucomicrobiae bacterium]|nr:hypothetical protein [Verrucomicrobiae bacterium]